MANRCKNNFTSATSSLLSGLIFLLIACITCLIIILRSIFNINIMSYYEIVGILSGFGIILSLINAEQKNAHITIDFIKKEEYRTLQIFSRIIVLTIYIAFTCGQFYAAYIMYFINNKTIIMHLPLWILYCMSGVCFFILSLVAIKKRFYND